MKAVSIIKFVFTAIGLAMLAGAFFFFTSTQDFLKSAASADGTVVALVPSRSSDSVTYAPVVQFMDKNGVLIEFRSSSSSNPPSYHEGEVVEVLYPESAPQRAKINGFFSLWGGATILAGLGSVFLIVGLSIIVFGNLKNKKIAFLKKNGTPVKARLKSIDLNHSLKVNGRSPYQINVQWENPEKSEVHVFRSENIWFDPTDHIADEEITVLIEKDNPKKYYVDISFLPKLAS
ncbi:DUF3592 domain-containing protein [Microbulbifer sp. ALW1]|uniref:DUF3592 domain-containing protein n=1 Tax=Microbulbifer sp. (strain ALW1) TaxID=1516059 RepID=UPI0013597207|nr:DUF3592 domain-containing protein [Microbulbifer sp. ALW1]